MPSPAGPGARLPRVFFCLLILVWGKKKKFFFSLVQCRGPPWEGEGLGGGLLSGGSPKLFLQRPSPGAALSSKPTSLCGRGGPLTSLDLGCGGSRAGRGCSQPPGVRLYVPRVWGWLSE